jgi:hypothetical protein
MSIDQANIIDFAGIDRVTGEPILTIADSSDWKDEYRHLVLLQEKINSYLQFIESGQVQRDFPASTGRKSVIKIVARFEPTKIGFEFLERARLTVEKAGFGFHFQLRTDLTASDDEDHHG